MGRPINKYLCALFAALIAAPACAEELSLGDLSLEELLNTTVVTASRHAQKMSEAPSAVSVLTAEDLKQMGVRTITEALNIIPGVDIRQNAGMPGGGVRGMELGTMNKIVLLVDGRVWVDDMYTFPLLDNLPVTLEEIDRIEVLRGAGSSLYGSGALYCVINIISKEAKDTKGLYLNGRYGNLKYHEGTARYGGSIGQKLDYRVSADGMKTGGWQDEETLYDKNNKATTRLDYRFENGGVLSIFGDYQKFHNDIPVYDKIIDGAANYTSETLTVRANAQYKEGNMSMGWGGDGTAIFVRRYSLDGQKSFSLIENNSLMVGGNATDIIVSYPGTIGHRERALFAGFIDDSYRLGKFIFNAGARVDTMPGEDASVSHRLAAIYALNDGHSFRLTWGKSFRNPDFLESYQIMGGTTTVSLPEAEKAQTYEVGYQGKLTSRLTAMTNLFYAKADDMISGTSNIGSGQEYGAEVEFQTVLNDQLTALANYTYLTFKGLSGTVDSTLDHTTPVHMFNVQLRGKAKSGLMANLWVHFRSHTQWSDGGFGGGLTVLPASTIVSARVAYPFDFLKGKAEAALSVYNLFNDPIYDTTSLEISRRYIADLTYKF